MSMKNSSDPTGHRTRDLPRSSAVPQPTASPRGAKYLSPERHLITLTPYVGQDMRVALQWS